MNTSTSEQLRGIVDSFSGRRVLLVGDMVADHYIYGRTSRISREAPVLILKHQEEFVLPGQAANTANNIVSLGAKAIPVGVIGRDNTGKRLRRALVERRVFTGSLIEEPGYRTLTKTRILAGGHHTCRQQVIRIDDDDREPLDGKVSGRVLEIIARYANDVDAIAVSDYGYGLVSPEVWSAVLDIKKRRKIPVLLDSRYDLTRFKGATLVTPNEGEALACCGLSTHQDYNIDNVGRELMRKTAAEGVLVTRGNEGMAVFCRGQKPHHIPIFGTDEVTDVTGAGDTVVACVSVAMAAGASTREACELANIAGGIVVMKMGTATVSRDELMTGLETGQPPVRLGA